jgi:hypothetical protein
MLGGEHTYDVVTGWQADNGLGKDEELMTSSSRVQVPPCVDSR